MIPPLAYFGEHREEEIDEDESVDSDPDEFSDDDLLTLEKRPYFQWE